MEFRPGKSSCKHGNDRTGYIKRWLNSLVSDFSRLTQLQGVSEL
jgi:hypothetical protein